VFVLGELFQPSLIFAGKAGGYPSEGFTLLGDPLWGRILALSTSIILGWKNLPWTNTLAYYENE
jgi:hypothetical protein